MSYFEYDSNKNLVIAAQTLDSSLQATASLASLVLYLSRSANSKWTWVTQLPFQAYDCKSIAFRQDDQRVALFYASGNIIVVLDTSNGNIKRVSQESSPAKMKCINECRLFYANQILALFAAAATTPQSLAYISFDPENGAYASTTIRTWGFNSKASTLTSNVVMGRSQYFVGLGIGTTLSSGIISFDHSVEENVNWMKSVGSAMVTGLAIEIGCDGCFGDDCCNEWSSLFVFQQSTTTFEAYISLYHAEDSDKLEETTQLVIPRSGVTGLKFLDMRPSGRWKAYVLVQYLGENSIVAYLYENDAQYGFFECDCDVGNLLTTRIINYVSSSFMIVTHGKIYSTVNFYVGGYNTWHFYSTTASSFKTSFIYSMDSAETSLSTPLVQNLQYPSNSYNTQSASDVSGDNAGPDCENVFNDVLEYKTSTKVQYYYETTPASVLYFNPIDPYVQRKYCLISDSATYPIPGPVTPSGCSGCTPSLVPELKSTIPGIVTTYSPTALTLKIEYSDPDVILTTPVIRFLSVATSTFYSTPKIDNLYIVKSHLYVLLAPTVIPDTTTYSVEIYYIDNPPYTTTQKFPHNLYTLGGIDPDLTDVLPDSRLDIHYKIVQTSDQTTPPWITSYDPATRKMVIQETDEALDGIHNMQILSYFSYNPTVFYKGEIFDIKLNDKCRMAKIYTSVQSPETFYYQLGEGPVDFPITFWTHDFPLDCGKTYYTFTTSSVIKTAISLNDTQSTTDLIMKIDSADPTMHMLKVSNRLPGYYTELIGTLYKLYTGDPVTSTQFVQGKTGISIRLIDTTISFIKPKPLPEVTYEYTVKDPALTILIPKFFVQDTDGLPVVFTLSRVDGIDEELDTTMFNHSSKKNPPIITLYTKENKKMGIYEFVMQARFNIRIPYYVQTEKITLTVFHECTKNIISSLEIKERTYNVSMTQINIDVQPFTMSRMSACVPITYEGKLEGGKMLPSFIKFSANPPMFSVFTMSSGAVGKYSVQISGTTQYYDKVNSIALRKFTLEIFCSTRKINPKPGEELLSATFAIGNPVVQAITFQQFEYFPICDPLTQVIYYTAGLITGEPLPSFITFKAKDRTLLIVDDGTLTPGNMQIQIYGRATDSKVRGFIILDLSITPPSPSLDEDLDNFIRLPSQLLMLQPGSTLDYRSNEFINYTNQAYTLIKSDPSLKFIGFSDQVVTIAPQVRDIGLHQLSLIAISEDQQKYLQQINVKVGFQKGAKEYGTYLEVEGKIVKISKSGQVRIMFNQGMQPPSNITSINDKTLTLRLKQNRFNSNENRNLNFTWNSVSYADSILTLQLHFEDPFSISTQGLDELEIRVQDRSAFVSLTGILIASKYKMIKEIPKQLDDSEASKYMDSIGLSLQDGIDAMTSGSVVFNIIFGFVMSRLWGLINSMQIIVLMPLISVDIPANVQLLYFLITDNMNFQILPIDLNKYGIFEFNSNDTPFTQQFYDQGYTSKFMLQNILENFMNLAAVIYIGACVRLVELIAFHWKKSFKILEMAKGVFLYNFIVMVLLENSLQFILFSLINLLNYDQLNSPSEISSYFFSVCFIIMLTSIGVWNYRVVMRNSKQRNLTIKEDNIKVAAIYELLRTTSKMALIYQSVFLLRRFLLALILVFLNDFQVGQIVAMTLVSLGQLGYFVCQQPFDDATLNRLEIFNEFIILLCYYHLLLFTGGLTEDIYLIYSVGWSMDALLMLQFTVNVCCLAYNLIMKIKAIINIVKMKLRLKEIEDQERRIQEKFLQQMKHLNENNNMNRIQKMGVIDDQGMFQDESRLEDILPVTLVEGQFVRQQDQDYSDQLSMLNRTATSAMPFNNARSFVNQRNSIMEENANNETSYPLHNQYSSIASNGFEKIQLQGNALQKIIQKTQQQKPEIFQRTPASSFIGQRRNTIALEAMPQKNQRRMSYL